MPDTLEKDLYGILGVSQADSADVISKKFRSLVRNIHPDKMEHAGEAEKRKAAQKYNEYSEAYGILSNGASRAKYDATYSLVHGSPVTNNDPASDSFWKAAATGGRRPSADQSPWGSVWGPGSSNGNQSQNSQNSEREIFDNAFSSFDYYAASDSTRARHAVTLQAALEKHSEWNIAAVYQAIVSQAVGVSDPAMQKLLATVTKKPEAERFLFQTQLERFDHYTATDTTRARYAVHLQAALENHPEWNTATVYQAIVSQAVGMPDPAMQKLLATVTKKPEAERLLFQTQLERFDHYAATDTTRARYAVHLQAALEKHPEWNTASVYQAIVSQAVGASDPVMQKLLATVTKKPEAERLLFQTQLERFYYHAATDTTRARYAVHLQAALENHPEWNTATVYQAIVSQAVGMPDPAMQKLLATVTKKPEAERFLFQTQLERFDYYAATDTTKARYAVHLQSALEKHPEWNTEAVYQAIVSGAARSSDPVVQKLLVTVNKKKPEAEEVVLNKQPGSSSNNNPNRPYRPFSARF